MLLDVKSKKDLYCIFEIKLYNAFKILALCIVKSTLSKKILVYIQNLSGIYSLFRI